MPYEVKGVVARSKGAPVTVETVLVPDPGPGDAVVDVQACGVCHTDLHYREGGINDDYPFLLGHEAAGVVAAVGEGVTNVAVGDFVGSFSDHPTIVRSIRSHLLTLPGDTVVRTGHGDDTTIAAEVLNVS